MEGKPQKGLEQAERPGMGAISLAESATRQITEMIGNGTLKEGERLPPERELAVTLNLSRGVLREALRTLETLGLVKARVGSGRYVSVSGFDDYSSGLSIWMNLQAVSDVIEVRRYLEPPAIEAIPATRVEATANECATALAKMNAAFTKRSYEAATRHHTRFHLALIQYAPSRLHRLLLVSMIRTAETAQLEIFRTPEAGRHSLAKHDAILEALQSGDIAETARREVGHLTLAFTYPFGIADGQEVDESRDTGRKTRA